MAVAIENFQESMYKGAVSEELFKEFMRKYNELVNSKDLIPVGDVVYRPYLKKGYVKANGATVLRADYPTLVSFAEENNLWTDDPTNQPWAYGVGDGSTTMVLPDYRNRVIQGGSVNEILEAGLPNLTGYSGMAGLYSPDVTANGVFTPSPRWVVNFATNTGVNSGVIYFNASYSNSTYGNSDTVQPKAIVTIPQIRY